MQLIEAAQQPILRIDARTKFALLFGVGISSLMFPPFWLEATTFALMALLLGAERLDDARRAAVDESYRDELMREFGISQAE